MLKIFQDWAEIVIAVAALVVAVRTTRFAGRDARRRATLDHLREVDDRLQGLWGCSTGELQTAVIAHYEDGNEPSAEAGRYLSFLNAIDLLGFASRHGMVDSALATKYTTALFQSTMLSQQFLEQFRKCCKSETSYENMHAPTDTQDINLKIQQQVDNLQHTASREQPKSPPPPPPPPARSDEEKATHIERPLENFLPIRP